MATHTPAACLLALTLLGGLTSTPAHAQPQAQCEPGWDDRFEPPMFGTDPAPIAVVGTGRDPMVLVSGRLWDDSYNEPLLPLFWDGHRWDRSLGGLTIDPRKTPTFVHAPHEDGVAYVFANRLRLENNELATVARWDGSAWTSLNGGSQPRLLTPGPESDPGRLAWIRGWGRDLTVVVRVAEQNTEIGRLNRERLPEVMLWYDDGTGDKLYIFGPFEAVGEEPISLAAVWDGVRWAEVGEGPGVIMTSAFVVQEDGRQVIYGTDWRFETLLRWDGVEWTVFADQGWPSGLELVGAADFGRGLRLIAQRGARFTRRPTWLWEWTGADWVQIPHSPDGEVSQLVTVESPDGPTIYASGEFRSINDVGATNLARWDGETWQDVGTAQTGKGIANGYSMLAVGPEGGALFGDRIYVGSTGAADLRAGHIRLGLLASWDGTRWEPLNLPAENRIDSVVGIRMADLGQGLRLIVATRSQHGGDYFSTVWQFDGRTWTTFGEFLELAPEVCTLMIYDSGNGPEPIVAGRFYLSGYGRVGVARFDGERWVPLGGSFDDDVRVLAVCDDGTGPKLYAGGTFSRIDEQEIAALAVWDGTSWSEVGGGLSEWSDDRQPYVNNIAEIILDGKRQLAVKGNFTVGGEPMWLAAWDGSNWSDLFGIVPTPIREMKSYETPHGLRTVVWDSSMDHLSFQRGEEWITVADDLDGYIGDVVFDDMGGVDSLYVVGGFSYLNNTPADGFARFGCPRCPADFDTDGDADSADVTAFLDLWTRGDIAADINTDGNVDTRDVVEFLNLWNDGC